MTEAETKGAHHIGLTVPDVKETSSFFVNVLGFSKVDERPEYPAIFVSDGNILITIWQCQNASSAVPFDRKNNVGLHHLALRVEPSKLDSLYARVGEAEGVAIEFAPEPLRGGPTRHMMCLIPGGVRVEFIAPSPSA